MPKNIFKIFSAIILVGALFFSVLSKCSFADDTIFQINVKEGLSVTISSSAAPATGNANEFLKDQFSLAVSTNNDCGFTAGMTTKTTSTDLVHYYESSMTIPTLTGNITCDGQNCTNFPTNRWGYSTNSTQYKPLVNINSAPATILSSAVNGSGSSTVAFGAKADLTKSSGTYSNTVVISVVSGTCGADLESAPSNPSTPNNTHNTAEYSASTGATTYTYTNSSGTTTQISAGDNRSLYDGYTPPQGTLEDSRYNIFGWSPLAVALTITGATAATSGTIFFILAKRKKDDDEEEEPQM